MAYITPLGKDEALQTFERRVYKTQHMVAIAARESREKRIIQISPYTNYTQVWNKLHAAWLSEETRSTCYNLVHDIRVFPTNERLNIIRLVDTDRCRDWANRDTLAPRLTECNEGTYIWWWTRERIAQLIRSDSYRIPTDWCLRPQLQIWPPQQIRAILWKLAHLVLTECSNDTYHW